MRIEINRKKVREQVVQLTELFWKLDWAERSYKSHSVNDVRLYCDNTYSYMSVCYQNVDVAVVDKEVKSVSFENSQLPKPARINVCEILGHGFTTLRILSGEQSQ